MATLHFRQAITTKFIGPTNTRQARIKATADVGSITIPWDYGLDTTENHRAAARALATTWGWEGQWMGGSLSGAGYVFVWCASLRGAKADGFRVSAGSSGMRDE